MAVIAPTNLFILYPELPLDSFSIAGTATATGFSRENSITGDRVDMVRSFTTVTTFDITYDMGAFGFAQPDYVVIARADILRNSDSAAVTVNIDGDSIAGFPAPENETFSIDFPDLVGPNSEDRIAEVTFSSTYRFWRFRTVTTDSIFHHFSKVYMGNGFDFGRDPIYQPNIENKRLRRESRTPARIITVEYRGITDAKKIEFVEKIYNRRESNPVFLWDRNDCVFDGDRLIHCKLLRGTFSFDNHRTWDIRLTFEELT